MRKSDGLRRSRRSLASACRRAGIAYDPHVIDATGLGLIFLDLLIAGVDHEYVGEPAWYSAMVLGAPAEAVPRGDDR